jgi:2-succinyl-5-enolpyruvyl-6-hydroxy-3-cyclohexene-1-carboxylate synthase
LAGDARVRVHVFLDERSAAFCALGIARATRHPVVVLCTSGTAAANLHPAVLEAHHGRVPLIVCTADRPPELRDTGAGQTVDQVDLYGAAVRWFSDPGPPEDLPGAGVHWRSVAARAVASALTPTPGPVHLNLAFREPLVPTGAPLVPAPGRADGRPWTVTAAGRRTPDAATVSRLVDLVQTTRRGIVVAGWGSDVSPATLERVVRGAGWPVLADPISGLRQGPGAISTYEALLRTPGFAARHRPDVVLRLGAPPTSKVLTAWLDAGVPQIVFDPHGAWLDPGHAASERLTVDGEPALAALADELSGPPADGTWFESWSVAERVARGAIDDQLDAWPSPFEGRVARDVVDDAPDGAAVVVASSMPVRDVEAFARPRPGIDFFANRGVNGIDGFVSTVLGIATVRPGPTIALLGDLAFLHDANGLLGAADRGVDATFVVLDNDGGGIFSFLPQADLPEHFEELFGTPHGIDLAAVASVHGIPAERVEKAADVSPAVTAAIGAGGVRVLIVPTDRAENVVRHREAWAAAAAALDR